MKDKIFFRKRLRLMLVMSPFIFAFSVWGTFELFKWAGFEISNKGKYIVTPITLIGFYAAMYQCIKKYFFKQNMSSILIVSIRSIDFQ